MKGQLHFFADNQYYKYSWDRLFILFTFVSKIRFQDIYNEKALLYQPYFGGQHRIAEKKSKKVGGKECFPPSSESCWWVLVTFPTP